jgi:hypothetical protein
MLIYLPAGYFQYKRISSQGKISRYFLFLLNIKTLKLKLFPLPDIFLRGSGKSGKK